MTNEIPDRVRLVAARLFPCGHAEVTAKGEDYFVIEFRTQDGRTSTLPPIWLPADASDREIEEKLSREFAQAEHPESEPDDLSVPNLRSEEKQSL